MRISRLIYIFVLLGFLCGQVRAQFFNPPYKVVKSNISFEKDKHFIESINPDSTQKPFFISIQNFGLFNPSANPSQMRFYDSEFKLIDAVNTNTSERYQIENLFLSDFDNDGMNEVIVPVIGEHNVKFYLINLHQNSANRIIFLTIPFIKKIPNVYAQYLRASDKLLIIYINTIFPGKHDYRRIYAIDTQNFSVKWEKQTADYAGILFKFSQTNNKDYFYCITKPFDNRLVFSNRTFYRLIDFKDKGIDKEKNLLTTVAVIDTFFGAKPYPIPDSTAKDFSCDTIGYIVKMDLNGNVILRKRFGGRLANARILHPFRGDSLLFSVFDRVHNSAEIKLFLDNKNIIKTIKKFKHDIILSIWRQGNNLFFSDSHKLWKNNLSNINAETDTIFTKYMYSVFPSNPNYFINTGDKYYHLFNKQFEKVADIPYSGLGNSLTYFKSLNSFAELSSNTTIFYKLEKASLRERLNETTFKWATATLIFILFIILLLWVYTMRLSRKKIERNYKLLQQSKTDLEATTSQLIRAEKLATLGTIASGVAHQLNSPLGAILNSAQRIQSNGNINDNIKLIEKAAIRSKEIVNRFLIASRPPDDTKMITDLNRSLKDFWELFGHQFEVSGIRIFHEIEDNITLKIRPTFFNEVLTNILFNARDSILENESENRNILISCKVENGKAILEVKDTGIGFSDLILSSGFEAFLTTKEKGKGTGLGLWLVEKIISDINGKTELGNYENGAFVRIELPTAS